MRTLTREALLARAPGPHPGLAAMDEAAVAAQLAELPHWRRDGGEIVRSYRFDDFRATMAFVQALAEVIHAEDHHPDLRIGYDRCELRYSTHAPRGLTLNDFVGAARADALFAAAAGRRGQ